MIERLKQAENVLVLARNAAQQARDLVPDEGVATDLTVVRQVEEIYARLLAYVSEVYDLWSQAKAEGQDDMAVTLHRILNLVSAFKNVTDTRIPPHSWITHLEKVSKQREEVLL